MKTAIVFDLDGTLVDSIGDLAGAANRMLAGVGRDPLSLEVIKRFVGNGLPKLVERVIQHCALPMDRHNELTQATLSHYNTAASDTTVPYPGIPETLSRLQDKGCVLGVCTNKPEAPARHVLDALDLSRYFDAVLGGDTLNARKPDPTHLMASFEALPPHDKRLFVGDSEVDAETSVRAKIPFLLFTEGYRKSPVAEIPNHVSYGSATELPALVERLSQERQY
ncbi:phosphoglycolate phosphatase [Ruegeria sp. EL01]|uniref:phosphoglycolate phosphatase n=1 Tax=Ruegeria sp. EL01 TaxID=2107578 RepID=UPI000EA7F398|nr:phosphoglycolate phosphatase [Ruegeria sp. EL01]